jgi:hypothetical protein
VDETGLLMNAIKQQIIEKGEKWLSTIEHELNILGMGGEYNSNV